MTASAPAGMNADIGLQVAIHGEHERQPTGYRAKPPIS